MYINYNILHIIITKLLELKQQQYIPIFRSHCILKPRHHKEKLKNTHRRKKMA